MLTVKELRVFQQQGTPTLLKSYTCFTSVVCALVRRNKVDLCTLVRRWRIPKVISRPHTMFRRDVSKVYKMCLQSQ